MATPVKHIGENGESRVYLDHAASTPVCDAAKQIMVEVMGGVGNAASVHQDGQKARHYVEIARRQVADALNVMPDEVIFTSGATEALTMAICGAADAGKIKRILCARTEHAAVLEAVKHTGLDVDWLEVDENGRVDLDQLEACLNRFQSAALVCVQAANNETGVIQPIDEIAQLLVGSHHQLCVDAVQMIGKLAFDGSHPMIHLVALSAHKFGGPQGVGALIVKDGVVLTPLTPGGGQEKNRRGGTQATMLIAGLGAALKACDEGLYDVESLAQLRDETEAFMREKCAGLVIFGRGARRIPTISNFAVPGLKGHSALIGFDIEHISVSVGSACSSGKIAGSHVLQAMDVSPELVNSGVRLSLGYTSTPQDLAQFKTVFETISARSSRAVA